MESLSDRLKKLDIEHASESDFVIESDTDEDCEDDMEEDREEDMEESPDDIYHRMKAEYVESDEKYHYKVLSIDVGIRHLGISVSTLREDFSFIEVAWLDVIDITEFQHSFGPSKDNCGLYHTKTFCDWLNHVFQENAYFFEDCDFILVERQPPMGFVVIEQLVFSKYRDKTILISPNSMHKFFRIGHLDYDGRKEAVIKIALMKIADPDLIQQLGFYNRAHDVADSICMVLFWIYGKHKDYKDKARKKFIMERRIHVYQKRKTMSTEEWFEMHRYIPRY